NKKRRFVLGLPVVHWSNKEAGTGTTLVPPFYMHTKNEGYTTGLAPTFFAGRDHHKSYEVLFPVFWRFTNREYGHATAVLFPFLYRRTGPSHLFSIMPVVFGEGGGDTKMASVLPLFFWQSKHPKEKDAERGWRFWMIPFYIHSYQTKTGSGVG